MRKFYRSKPKTTNQKKYWVNNEIRSPELRVISETGEQLGILPTAEAIERARGLGLDLVEVSPNADPPVAKIINFNKLNYETEKKKRKEKSRQKKVEIKGIRLSMKISDHDKDFRKKQILQFFEKGHKVKLEMVLKGRENQHKDLAKKMLEAFIDGINRDKELKLEQEISKQGNRFTAILTAK